MSDAGSADLQLPEALDAVAATALRQSLLERLSIPLIVDASQVQRLSTPALQVLMAAAKSWAAAGQGFAIIRESDAFRSARLLLGLTPDHLPVGNPES
jgi:anti-anti-sigma regulatory factor